MPPKQKTVDKLPPNGKRPVKRSSVNTLDSLEYEPTRTFSITLPDTHYDKVFAQARANDRSVTAQVRVIIASWLETDSGS